MQKESLLFFFSKVAKLTGLIWFLIPVNSFQENDENDVVEDVFVVVVPTVNVAFSRNPSPQLLPSVAVKVLIRVTTAAIKRDSPRIKSEAEAFLRPVVRRW